MGRKINRRQFMKTSAKTAGVALTAASVGPFISTSAFAAKEIKIGYLKATHHAGLFVALEQGYYKDQGLNVKPVLFSGSGEIGAGLVSGSLQAGYLGSSPSIGMVCRNTPMSIVSGSAMESSAIVVPFNRPSKIKNIDDLRGVRIGTIRAATADIVVRYKMLKRGIDPFKDATVRNFTHVQDILTGLEKGDLDCAILWEPWATHAEAIKYAKPAFFSGDIWPRHTCCRMAFNTDWAAKNNGAATKVMNGHIRGFQHLRTNFDDNVAANAKWCGIPEEEIAVVFKEKRQRLTLSLDPEGSQEFAIATKALGIIENAKFQKNGLDGRYQKMSMKSLGLSSLPPEL
ncbi:MAG TPA: ABC transporter substrate-binding protein [Nitrospinota bacterium]|nr:ABC transporter substrate-binding protein [Nitrospinota bacterium]